MHRHVCSVCRRDICDVGLSVCLRRWCASHHRTSCHESRRIDPLDTRMEAWSTTWRHAAHMQHTCTYRGITVHHIRIPHPASRSLHILVDIRIGNASHHIPSHPIPSCMPDFDLTTCYMSCLKRASPLHPYGLSPCCTASRCVLPAAPTSVAILNASCASARSCCARSSSSSCLIHYTQGERTSTQSTQSTRNSTTHTRDGQEHMSTLSLRHVII